MTTLTQLLERLEAAPGGSRELDEAMCLALGWTVSSRAGGEVDWLRPDGTSTLWHRAPLVTQSLDAATALIGEMLPGYRRMVGTQNINGDGGDYDGPAAFLWRPELEMYDSDIVLAKAPTEPLALCIALVRALIAKEAT